MARASRSGIHLRPRRTSRGRARRAAWAVACIALGAFATLASGEWRVSPLYLLVDVFDWPMMRQCMLGIKRRAEALARS